MHTHVHTPTPPKLQNGILQGTQIQIVLFYSQYFSVFSRKYLPMSQIYFYNQEKKFAT